MGDNLGTFLGRSAQALWLGVVLSSGVAVSAPGTCEVELFRAGERATSQEIQKNHRSHSAPDIKSLLTAIGAHALPPKRELSPPKFRTPEEHWRAAGLKFSALKTFVDNEKCYSTEIHFLMCIAAARALVKFSPDALTLVPKDRREIGHLFGKTVENLGAIEIVVSKEIQVEPSILPSVTRKIEAAIRSQWLKLYDREEWIDFTSLLDTFKNRFVSSTRESYITATAINEALLQADAHSRIETTTHLQQSQRSSNEDLVGIGLVPGLHRGKILVHEVLPGSPAERAGIKVRDQILEVAGKSANEIGIQNISRRIRGAVGTDIQVKLARKGAIFPLSIRRTAIRVDNVQAKMVYAREVPVGYLRLMSFMDPTAPEQLGEEIKKLQNAGARALILDLRQNPGGLLTAAVEIGGLFLGSGKHAVTQKAIVKDRKDVKHITSMEKVTDLPLVVLIDSSSASASELLSGLLQDEGRAVIVGERSFGKGTVQSHIDFSTLDPQFLGLPVVFWRTVARFVLPSGRTTQIDGVTPHVVVARDPDQDPSKVTAMREEDLYPNALPPTEKVQLPQFSKRDEWLRQCMAGSGTARALYGEDADTDLPHDFQLLSALDAAKCLEQYGEWKEAYASR